MERVTTLFLKATVILIGILALVVCDLGLPAVGREALKAFTDYAVYSIIGVYYLSALPVFAALYQALKLLSYIDKNIAFSELSIRALKTITYSAVAISQLNVISLPFMLLIAHEDDAPGLIVIGIIIVFASLVIAVFAAVLQKLLKNAIEKKSENDLTV